MHIEDYISLDEFQQMQDQWSMATGFAFVTVDGEGKPITKPSGFTKFCTEMRNNPESYERCCMCDAKGGEIARKLGRPYVYKCHAGLIDFASPIEVNGIFLGSILAGQTTLVEQEHFKNITEDQTHWRDDAQLVKYYNEIYYNNLDKVESTAKIIFESYSYVLQKGYVNAIETELQEQKLFLIEKEKKNLELEKSMKEIELKALHYQINPHFLFNVLNTIGRIAYFEGATVTEDLVYSFSHMMRYILKKNTAQLIALSDEIEHIQNYLKIQEVRFGQRLQYRIMIPSMYYSTSIPFMTLQPVIENCIKYVVEPSEHKKTIEVLAYDEGTNLIIEIRDDGMGIGKEALDLIFSENAGTSHSSNHIGLSNVNSRLIHYFGDAYKMQILSPTTSTGGTTVKIKLPLHFC